MFLVPALVISTLLPAEATSIPLRPLDEVVTVIGGGQPKEWRRTLRDELNQGRFVIVLRPLIAVEGGTVAFEIVVSRRGSERNLLGERPGFDERCACYPPKTSVLTVEDFRNGPEMSGSGPKRRFSIPSSTSVLRVDIQEVIIGQGVGLCDGCERIDRLKARIRVEAR